MKDALLATFLHTARDKALDALRDGAAELAVKLFQKGVDVALDRLSGKVSDAAILEHLAAVQAKEVGQ